jgi:hypothetical protein
MENKYKVKKLKNFQQDELRCQYQMYKEKWKSLWRSGYLERPLSKTDPIFNTARFLSVGTTEGKELQYEHSQNTCQESVAIRADKLQCVFANTEHHIQLCMGADGGLISEPNVTGWSFTRTETYT